MHLRIAASPSPVDFDQEDVDVAVRIGRGAFEGVVAIKLFHEWLAPVASPAFLRQNILRKPADIARVPMLHDNSMRRAGRPQGWQEWFRVAVFRCRKPPVQHISTTVTLHCRQRPPAAALRSDDSSTRSTTSQAKRLRIAMQPVIEMDIAITC